MAATAELATPKATPDVAKINGMASRTLWVSKLGAKGSPSQVVVPAWKGVSADQIDQLHNTLARDFGPGTYKFEVSDGTGPEKDTWTAKLGGDTPEGSMSGNGFNSSPVGLPAGEGALRDLGHGYLYNESLGLLTTPARELFEWRPGMPLPLPGRMGAAAQTSTLPPWATATPGWGSIPVNDGSDNRTRALESQIADERRRREMDEVKSTFAKLVEDTNRRFEQIVEKLTARPSGPSPSEQALMAELAAVRQQVTTQQTQAEATARDERLRAEMQAMQTRFESLLREIAGNKQDPMLSMLTQIMTTAQAAQASTVQAMRDSTTASAQAAENNARLVSERLGSSIMSPMQIVDMIRMAKDTSSNDVVNKQMIEMFQSVFGMAKNLIHEQAEMNSQGSGPAWLPIAQQALERVGTVAQAYAARQTAPQQLAAPARRAQPRQQPQQPQRQVAAVERPQVLPAAPAPQRPLTAAEMREQAAGEAALFRPGTTPAVVAVPTSVQPAQQPQPSAPPPVATTKKRRGRSQTSSASAAPPPPPVMSPMELLRAAPIDDVRKEVASYTDEVFFGPFHSQVLKLREAVMNDGLASNQAAEAVLMSRAYFASYGELPPAIELLNANHIEVLVERLLPDVDDEYCEGVVEEIRAQIEGEAEGGGEAQGDDEAA